MPEFGADGPGFAIHDPEVDAMYENYLPPSAGYWVVEGEGVVLGGGGFAQLVGGPEGVCELRKMYFMPELRGQGFGRRLLELILTEAKEAGFRECYLETLHTMRDARRLYERAGFSEIDGPIGATGHCGCDAWFVRSL
jgi:putative acetyltransferase